MSESKQYFYLVEYDGEAVIIEKLNSNGINSQEEAKEFYRYYCKFLFSRESQLDRQMENHFQVRCLKCDYTTLAETTPHRECPQIVPTEGLTSKRFYCYDCKFLFSRMSLLDKHMQKHFQSPCPNCDYTRSERDFDSNEADILSVKSNIYTCINCGHNFHSYRHLKWHLLTHGTAKYYGCSKCDYKTKKQLDLKRHRKTHTGKKLLACSKCDYKTENEILIVKHIRTHKEKMKRKYKNLQMKVTKCSSLKTLRICNSI